MIITEKTVEFDKWIRKLKDIGRNLKYFSEFKNSKPMNTLEIVNQLVTELAKCESITLKVIEYTLRKKIKKS